MNKQYEELHKMDDETEKPRLKLITGGNNGDDENWLQRLDVGAIFTCRQIPYPQRDPKEYPIHEFEITVKYPNGDVKLTREVLGVEQVEIVDSLEFSRAFRKRCISYEGD